MTAVVPQPACPCSRTTWCVLELGHDPPCLEVPRVAQPAPDFGPDALKNRGRR